MISWSLIASPFFLVGSVLWLVSPLLCLLESGSGGEDSFLGLSIGVAASLCFLVDCSCCLLEWRASLERYRLNLVAVLIYGLASCFDTINASLDLAWRSVDGSPWYVGCWADAGFTIAGTLEAIHNFRIRNWLGFVGSLFFAGGGLCYVISGIICDVVGSNPPPSLDYRCWFGDIIAAVLFCVNALIVFAHAFRPVATDLWRKIFKKEDQQPLFKDDGTENLSVSLEESDNDLK